MKLSRKLTGILIQCKRCDGHGNWSGYWNWFWHGHSVNVPLSRPGHPREPRWISVGHHNKHFTLITLGQFHKSRFHKSHNAPAPPPTMHPRAELYTIDNPDSGLNAFVSCSKPPAVIVQYGIEIYWPQFSVWNRYQHKINMKAFCSMLGLHQPLQHKMCIHLFIYMYICLCCFRSDYTECHSLVISQRWQLLCCQIFHNVLYSNTVVNTTETLTISLEDIQRPQRHFTSPHITVLVTFICLCLEFTE